MSTSRRRLYVGESSQQGAERRVRQHHGENIAQAPNFLDFSTTTPMTTKLKFTTKLEVLKRKIIMSGGFVDWNVFKNDDGSASIYDDLSTFLDVDYVDAKDGFQFKVQVWRNLFSINEPLHRELILEFLSTYSFRYNRTFISARTAINFRLGGIRRNLSIVELADILGLYSPDIINHQRFIPYLRAAREDVPDGILNAFWSHIAHGIYRPRAYRTTSIRDPIIQIFHKLLIKTITSRQEIKGMVNRDDLFLLYCIANRIHVNVPLLIAKYLSEVARSSPNPSITGGGQFITRIARYFGLLTETNLRVLHPLDPMERLGRDYWIQMGICKSTSDRNTNLQLISRYNWVISDEGLEPVSESMEHVESTEEPLEQEVGLEEHIIPENLTQLLTIPEAESREHGQAFIEHIVSNPNPSVEQQISNMAREMRSLTLQVNEHTDNLGTAGLERIIIGLRLDNLEQRLELLGHQMEWLHRRYEHVYPPINYPDDPWPTMLYPPPPPPPQL